MGCPIEHMLLFGYILRIYECILSDKIKIKASNAAGRWREKDKMCVCVCVSVASFDAPNSSIQTPKGAYVASSRIDGTRHTHIRDMRSIIHDTMNNILNVSHNLYFVNYTKGLSIVL